MKTLIQGIIFLTFLFYVPSSFGGCEKAYEKIILSGLINYETTTQKGTNIIGKDWYRYYMEQTRNMLKIIKESEANFLYGDATEKMYLELEKSLSKREIQSLLRMANKSFKLCYKNQPIVLFKDFKLYLSARIKLRPKKLRFSYIQR